MSGKVLATGSGAKGLLLAAFETNASMTLDELEVKTGLMRDTLKHCLARHPELFKAIRPGNGIIQWELMPKAPEIVAAIITSVEMGKGEKREILAQIARWPLPYDAQVTAKQKTEAIAELNKMDGDYAPEKHQDIVGIQVVHIRFEDLSLDEKAKLLSLPDGGER